MATPRTARDNKVTSACSECSTTRLSLVLLHWTRFLYGGSTTLSPRNSSGLPLGEEPSVGVAQQEPVGLPKHLPQLQRLLDQRGLEPPAHTQTPLNSRIPEQRDKERGLGPHPVLLSDDGAV